MFVTVLFPLKLIWESGTLVFLSGHSIGAHLLRLGYFLDFVGFALVSPQVMNELIGPGRIENWRKSSWSWLTRTITNLLKTFLLVGALFVPSGHEGEFLLNQEAEATGLPTRLVRLHYIFSLLFAAILLVYVTQILQGLYGLRITAREIPLSVLLIMTAIVGVAGALIDILCLVVSKPGSRLTPQIAVKMGLFFPIFSFLLKSRKGRLAILLFSVSMVLYPLSSAMVALIYFGSIIISFPLLLGLILLGLLRLLFERSVITRRKMLVVGMLCLFFGFLLQFISTFYE